MMRGRAEGVVPAFNAIALFDTGAAQLDIAVSSPRTSPSPTRNRARPSPPPWPSRCTVSTKSWPGGRPRVSPCLTPRRHRSNASSSPRMKDASTALGYERTPDARPPDHRRPPARPALEPIREPV